jgi:hypothetical protein
MLGIFVALWSTNAVAYGLPHILDLRAVEALGRAHLPALVFWSGLTQVLPPYVLKMAVSLNLCPSRFGDSPTSPQPIVQRDFEAPWAEGRFDLILAFPVVFASSPPQTWAKLLRPTILRGATAGMPATFF